MLLTNAEIWTMDGPDIPRGYVWLEEERIKAVGRMEQCPQTEEETLDLDGRLLLPGFIDAHSHIGLSEDGVGDEGDDLNEEVDPVTPHLRALDGINPFDRCFAEARAAGVTCTVVSPGSANPVAGQICALKTAGRWVDRMVVAAPLAMKFALGENPKMTYGAKAAGPFTRMATAALIREQLQKAQRYLEDQQAAEENPELDGPEYDMRCEAMLPVLQGEIQAHFHAHKAYDMLTAMRIAEEFGLRCTLVHGTEGYLIADILAERNVPVICGPMIGARTKPELAGMRTQNCAKLAEAGVRVAISTDHPEVPVEFLAASAAIAASEGMLRRSALEAVTVTAARMLGLEGRVGSIAVGKDADLCVWAGDLLTLGARPEMVFISGRRVV